MLRTPSSIIALGSPSAKKRALAMPSGKARAESACGTPGARSGIEQPATAMRAMDSAASDANLCRIKTLSELKYPADDRTRALKCRNTRTRVAGDHDDRG